MNTCPVCGEVFEHREEFDEHVWQTHPDEVALAKAEDDVIEPAEASE